jgi:3-deoxy-D-manno-octulosonic acid (KDO) 8-phosphate synthase
VNSGEILPIDYPDVFGMSFGNNQCVSDINGIDVCERQNPVVFENLETRDFTPDDLAEDTAFH